MEWIILALVLYSVCLTIEFRQLEYNNNQLEKETKNLKPNTMTELPKEWQQEAEKSSELQEATYTPQHQVTYTHGFIDGATAYKQAVEAELNRRIEFRQKAHSKFIRSEFKIVNSAAIKTLKGILTELQTLKPTSND